MQQTLDQKAKIFIEDRMSPKMEDAIQSETCSTEVQCISAVNWGFGWLKGEFGLHIEVPVLNGSKTFLYQDAKKIKELLAHLGATSIKELAGKPVVVYHDPRFDKGSNPVGISAQKELECYTLQGMESLDKE